MTQDNGPSNQSPAPQPVGLEKPEAPHAQSPAPKAPPPEATPPRRRRRRWLKVLGVVVLLLVLLVVFLPTIASLGPVRALVVGQVNGAIPGRLEVGSYSVGWFSPTVIENVKLFDSEGRQILAAQTVRVESSLSSLASEPMHLGKVLVNADATNIVVKPDGSTNLDDALGLKSSTPRKPDDKPAGELPDLRMDLSLELTGAVTLVDAQDKHVATVQIRPGTGGTVVIADVNQGVTTDLKIVYDVMRGNAAGPTSTITLAGTVDAVQNGRLALDALTANLKLVLDQVDLGAAQPVLAMAGVNDVVVKALASGSLDVDWQPQQTGLAKGEIVLAVDELRLPQLKDPYRASEPIRLPIDVARVSENGQPRLRVDVRAIAPELMASITGNLPEAALQRLADKQMPGSDGTLSVELTAHPARIAQQFPNTLQIEQGVAVNDGLIHAKADLWLGKDQIVYGVSSNVRVSGTRDGKPIRIEPIELATRGTLTRIDDPVAGLRDVTLKLASAFATAEGGGASVEDLQLGAKVDLDKARQQAAQFANLDGIDLAGNATLSLRNTAAAKEAYSVNAEATLTALKVKLPQLAHAIDIAYAKAGASGTCRLSGTDLAGVDDASVSLLLGESADKPLLDVLATLDQIDPKAMKVGAFKVERGTITDLPRVQAQIEPFFSLKEMGLDFVSGQAYFAASGSADVGGKTKTITLSNLEATTPNLQVRYRGKALPKDRYVVALAGTIAQSPERQTVDLDRFSLASDTKALVVSKTDEPLKVVLGDAMPHGAGTLKIAADLPAVNRIAAAFTDEPIADVRSGQLSATLALTSGVESSQVTLDGAITGLSIPNVVENQKIGLALSGSVEGDPTKAERATVNLDVQGDDLVLLKTLKPAVVDLRTGTPVHKVVERGQLQVAAPNAPRAAQVAGALVPGLSLPYEPTSGAVALTADLVPGEASVLFEASRLRLRDPKTKREFAFNPKQRMTLQLHATTKGEQELTQVVIDKLQGDLDVVQLSLPEAIVIDTPLTQPKPQGQIELTGDLSRASALLAFLQGADKPMPYRGLLTLKSRMAVDGQTVRATLDGSVKDLTLLDEQGKPLVADQQVKIDGDVVANLDAKTAQINKIGLTSDAATVTVTGGLSDFTGPAIGLERVVARVDAAGEKAWPLVLPLLPPAQQAQLASAKITGPLTLNATADGVYRIDRAFNETISSLNVAGDLSVSSIDLYDSHGLRLTDFLQYFTIRNGELVTGKLEDGKWTFAPPGKVNGGQINLGSIVVNLADPNMPVSVGKNQKLLTAVQLNPIMAAQLGKSASLIFKDAKQASGLVDVVVAECKGLPLAELLTSKQGTATVLYSVRDLRVDGPIPSTLSGLLGWNESGIVGNINDASLSLVKGVAYQNMTLSLLKGTEQKMVNGQTQDVPIIERMQFKGGLNLASNKLSDYQIWLSEGLVPRELRRYLPNGLTLWLSGDVSDFSKLVQKSLAETIKKNTQNVIEDQAQDLLKGLIDKK